MNMCHVDRQRRVINSSPLRVCRADQTHPTSHRRQQDQRRVASLYLPDKMSAATNTPDIA